MTNLHNRVLYCGATTDLHRRIQEHKNSMYTNSFTSRYNVNKLVYFESFTDSADAFIREKQIKAGSRKKKIGLIVSINPSWNDLSESFITSPLEELNRLKTFLKK